jgi:hypothetical protein
MKNEKDKNENASRIGLPRRQFLWKAGLGLSAMAALSPAVMAGGLANGLPELLTAGGKKDSRYFRFAVISDTHIIDEFYKGPESNALDSETVFKTTERLTSVRTLFNSLNPAIEKVFVCGDFFHDYPSTDYDFYFKNKTRIDNAKELIDGFKMPVHVALGNHDYNVPKVTREVSHKLFKEKLKIEPYYSVKHRDHKFVILNNFIGETWNPESKDYNKQVGSYGETQLNWFESELKEGKPTYVFQHFPLYNTKETEIGDYGMLPLLKKYKDTIKIFFSGHWHRWFDFAHTFGPQHYTVASTRYDQNAYMIIEVDTKTNSWKVLNFDLIDWATRNSAPFKG